MDAQRLLSLRLAFVLLTMPAWPLAQTARAVDGASSNYFPDTYGDYAVAAAPEPGWTYLNYSTRAQWML